MALTCLVSAGMENTCKTNSPGLFSIFITNYPSGVTSAADFVTYDVEGKITAFSGATITTPLEFYKYKPAKNSSTFDQTFNVSIENGVAGVEQKITAVFPVMTQERSEQISNLIAGNFLIIALDRNNRYWVLGLNDSVETSGGSSSTGKGGTDLAGYTLELSAWEAKLAIECEASAIVLA